MLLRECAAGSAPAELAELIEELTRTEPDRRPASAREALARIRPDRQVAAQDVSMHDRPEHHRGPPYAGELRIRIDRRSALLLAAALGLILLATVIASIGGDAPSTPPREAPGSPGAPLDRQLDALERAVRQAGLGDR